MCRKRRALRRAVFIFSHIRKPNSVLCNHLSRRCITTLLKRLSSTRPARSCIRVRILPFHFCISAKLIQINLDATFFRLWRLCSHLLDHSRRALPSTLLHSFAMGMFGLSTLLRARLLNMTFDTIPEILRVVNLQPHKLISYFN